jgi:hypothetical protein
VDGGGGLLSTDPFVSDLEAAIAFIHENSTLPNYATRIFILDQRDELISGFLASSFGRFIE